MGKKLEALRGMEDILPGDIEKWQWLEEKARVFFESKSYREIRTPILEYTDLFVRSVGESSDIVHKEMFAFEDRGGRNVVMRPEMTASVARAVIEHGLLRQAGTLRLYYIAPMFRAERPQAGRKRQFHQIGSEIIGPTDVASDFECIAALHYFLRFVGVKEMKIRINDLGDATQQKNMAEALRMYFSGQKEKLCKDCNWRLEKNVLRIFDCKVTACQSIIDAAPWDTIAPLSESFNAMIEQLKIHEIPYEINRRLVRGLDYYNGPVFEIACDGLGAQDAVAGGGRYDRLHEELGGKATPCTGFSIGMERLLAVLEKDNQVIEREIKGRKLYLALLESDREVLRYFRQVALKLRSGGFCVESVPGETSLSKHLKKANQRGTRFVLILGTEEYQKKAWTVKDMAENKQEEVKETDLLSYLQGALVS